MKTFNHTILRKVVRKGSNSLYSQHFFQAVEKTRLELASLDCGYDGRYTEARYPGSDEAFCHGFSGDITDGNDLRPSGVAINACQQECEAIRW
ncbi:hypothetical protein TNIN_103121 [Trichonephila inaurata madagascariensis]|uniref:Uncharacterized protein n=1 Tax=Trichonephila inaurata madagascariensis TaxID=2747483 RepID=A0A8X6JKK2_9ARAC|nr:hypothetical protein TNIN_103121 [Trichonephila inaurata madagascariensis]